MTEGSYEEPRRRPEDSGATTGSTTEQQDQQVQKSPPYNFRIAAIALVAASLVFVLTMLVFAGLFKEASQVTTALGTLFTLIGTVVGAYFGIKSTNDAVDKAQGEIRAANKSAKAALGELDPERARDLIDKGLV